MRVKTGVMKTDTFLSPMRPEILGELKVKSFIKYASRYAY